MAWRLGRWLFGRCLDWCLARSALGGLLAVDRLVYLWFQVMGCRWVWGGYGAMGDGFSGFRSAVGGGFGWVDKLFFFLCVWWWVFWWWFGGFGVRKFTLWWCLVWVCWVVSGFASWIWFFMVVCLVNSGGVWWWFAGGFDW